MKKDWDTIAAVEQAIAKKYGKESVQDFRSGWEPEKEKEYLEQIKARRKITESKSSENHTIIKGDITINKKNKKTNTERTCPVCKTYSFSRRDDLYMNRFKCCEQCYIIFVVNREERWRNRWRPDDDQVKKSLRRKN